MSMPQVLPEDRRFSWFPITCVRADRQQVVLLNGLRYRDYTTPPEVIMEDAYEGRHKLIRQVISDTPTEFRFISEPAGTLFVFRPTIPEDAANTFELGIGIPLPVEIIGGIMSGTISNPSISAAVDSTGDVHTMILETDTGLYARYSRQWIFMKDISPIEQLDIVDVPPTDLEHYDMADDLGKTISIRDLAPYDRPAVGAVGPSRNEPATPVTAAASMIVIASAADLPDGIAWAETHPEARWYVTRKAQTLGWNGPMPWDDQ